MPLAPKPPASASRLPLLALALASFGIGTTEFVIMGLLPDVAGDLGITIPYGQKIETAQRRRVPTFVGLGPVLHNKLAVDA